MKKNLLYLLAAGLSGTAFLHAADTVKLDRYPKKIYQTCSGRPMASTVRNPANVQPRPP